VRQPQNILSELSQGRLQPSSQLMSLKMQSCFALPWIGKRRAFVEVAEMYSDC